MEDEEGSGAEEFESIFDDVIDNLQPISIPIRERASVSSALNFIDSLQDTSGGFGIESEDEINPLMTGYSLWMNGLCETKIEVQEVESALNFLSLVKGKNGGFSYFNSGSESLLPSAVISNALQSLGVVPTDPLLNSVNQYVFDHFQSLFATAEDSSEGPPHRLDLCLIMMCMLAIGQGLPLETNTSVIELLATRRLADGGWGLPTATMSDVDNTAFALTILESSRVNDDKIEQQRSTLINSAQKFLIDAQMDDGGWIARPGDRFASIDSTGLTLRALRLSLGETTETMVRGMNYLITTQNSDGGWGDHLDQSSDADSTFWAISGISSVAGRLVPLIEVESHLTDAKERMSTIYNAKVKSIAGQIKDAIMKRVKVVIGALASVGAAAGTFVAKSGLF